MTKVWSGAEHDIISRMLLVASPIRDESNGKPIEKLFFSYSILQIFVSSYGALLGL